MKRWTCARILTGLTFLWMLSACGSKGSGSDLVGTWKLACVDGVSGGGVVISMVFDGAKATSVIDFYTENTCTTLIAKNEAVVTYVAGGVYSGVTGAKEIDFTSVSETWTAITADGKTYLEGECAAKTFVVGQPLAVTGECGTDAVGKVEYALYKVDATASPNRLYASSANGAAHDGSTAEKRHNEIDSSIYLSKQ